MMRVFLAALLCACSPLAAQDYLYHQENFEKMAKAVMAKQSCKRFGYIVDDKGIADLAEQFIVDAVKDGLSVKTARLLAKSAIQEEENRQDLILKNAKSNIGKSQTDDEKSKLLVEFLTYWSESCAHLSQDSKIGKLFLVPATGLKNPLE